MRWGRVVVVAATLISAILVAPLGKTSPVDAAPMSGVQFVSSQRVMDQNNVAIGTHQVTAFGDFLPAGSTQALVRITFSSTTASQTTGALMAHSCAAPPNPASDIVLPLQSNSTATNDVYVPIDNAGVFCLTNTVVASRVIVDIEGFDTSGPGASYVDLPFTFTETIVGPTSGTKLNLGPASVPQDASGAALWLVASPTTAGFARVYPCGAQIPLASQINWGSDDPVESLIAGVLVAPSAGLCIDIIGTASIDVFVDGYYSPTATPTNTSPPQLRYTQGHAPGFVGTTPTRLFDTRDLGSPIGGGQVFELDVSPFVPAEATAVVMNVTATEPQGPGFVTVYPCDNDRPEASSLNVTAGVTVPNLVTVDVGISGTVCFFAQTTTHLLADLAGYYRIGGGDGFVPSSTPVRMFDTRNTSKLASGSTFEFDLSPFVDADATSAVFNLTATGVENNGFVTAFPCGTGRPLASNLNVTTGQTVPNLVTVALPANKHVCFFTASRANLIADLAGWYASSATSGFISISPIRWVDTRLQSVVPLPPDAYSVDFGTDIPDATAVVLNATVVSPGLPGFLTTYPCSPQPPLASNVNFVAGQIVPNMVVSALDADGFLCVLNSTATHWLLDLSGYFTDSPFFFSFSPEGTDNL